MGRQREREMENGDRSKRTTDNEQTWSYYFENVRVFHSAFVSFKFVLHLTWLKWDTLKVANIYKVCVWKFVYVRLRIVNKNQN